MFDLLRKHCKHANISVYFQEKNKLQEEMQELSLSREASESSLSSLHCLKLAQASLKERYAKMAQTYTELQAEYSKNKVGRSLQ